MRDVLVRVLQGMLGAYESLLATRKKGSKSSVPLSQQEALQAVFNVKYILHMIPWRDDSEVCLHSLSVYRRESLQIIV